MNSLGRKVLLASLGILILISGLYVLVTRELIAWNEASAGVMRDYRRAMLDGEVQRALTRAAGETASYVLGGGEHYRGEAEHAMEQANGATAELRRQAEEPRTPGDAYHLQLLARQERLLRSTVESLRQAIAAGASAGTTADANPLRQIYAYEGESDALWREIGAHHRAEQEENAAALQNHSHRVRVFFLAGMAMVAVAAALLIGYVRQRVVNPLTLLAGLTRSVAAGDLTRRARVTHADEIGQLQRSFNQMVSDLEQQRGQLRALIERLESSRDAAQEASRAKSDFLANVSHEIRTPMNGVLVGLDLLHETATSAEQGELVDMARTSARHLLGMLNDLLDFSRIEAGRLELESVLFEPRALVEKMVGLHGRRAAAKGVAMSCHVADELPARLCGDPTRLGQVLLNLLDNAIKFTEEGAIEVAVSIDAAASGPPVGARPAHMPIWLRVRVTDTGIGIAPAHADGVFQPFFQGERPGHRNHEGMGLGLSIARQLARLMGGDLGFKSEPGKGSSFWFTARLLPEQQCVAAGQRTAGKPPQLPAGKAILLVEDHRDTREVVARTLRRRGLMVTTAEDGRTALALATTQDFDLVLMDCRMREMDGFAATRAIRASGGARSAVPIVALTAYGLAGPKQQYLEAGFDDLVVKPYTIEEIEEMLHRWLVQKPRERRPHGAPDASADRRDAAT